MLSYYLLILDASFIHFICQEDNELQQGTIVNKFFQEHADFISKSGIFEGREYTIFHPDHGDLKSGMSYFWHANNTYRRTEVLGKLATRVCSKILGIGSAERAWGDVKQLKSGKRSHLSADKVKKQATLFGESSMQVAKLKRKTASKDDKYALTDYWFDDGLEVVMESLNPQKVSVPPSTTRQRIFRA